MSADPNSAHLPSLPATREAVASAQRMADGWLITVVHPCHFSVEVRSLDEADCAVERALMSRAVRLPMPIELHIYWYH